VILAGDSRFMAPGDMPERIQAFCRDTGQNIPQTKEEIIRCALESLALEYRYVAESMEKMVGRRLPVIHIIGGGSRNRLLNQFTANATGCTVVAGPVEATAIGNILSQAMAMGYITSLEEGRKMVSRSFEMSEFKPFDTANWDKAYKKYLRIKVIAG
jgi:rhamnulokinase